MRAVSGGPVSPYEMLKHLYPTDGRSLARKRTWRKFCFCIQNLQRNFFLGREIHKLGMFEKIRFHNGITLPIQRVKHNQRVLRYVNLIGQLAERPIHHIFDLE